MATLKPSQLPRARDLLTKQLFAILLPAFAPLIGTRMTRGLIESLARLTLPAVAQHRDRFIALAKAQYKSMEDVAGIAAPPLRAYTVESWAAALERAWSSKLTERPRDDGPVSWPNSPAEVEPLTRDDVARALNTADHQGRDAERSQLIAYSLADEQVLGWTRVDFSPPTCPFCTVLISRGPVYTSAETAGGREKFHTGDTCSVILVTRANRGSYPGIEHTMAAQKAWAAASRGAKSGAETLANLRKDYRAQKEAGPVGAAAAAAARQATRDDNARRQDLDAARRQLEVIEQMQPKAESAKQYQKTAAAQIRQRIAQLEKEIAA